MAKKLHRETDLSERHLNNEINVLGDIIAFVQKYSPAKRPMDSVVREDDDDDDECVPFFCYGRRLFALAGLLPGVTFRYTRTNTIKST